MWMQPARADALAAALDFGQDIPVCKACLSFVSFAIDGGDPRKIAGQTRSMTPLLWAEGLAEPALEAMRRVCDLGVPDARAALADLEQNGGRSWAARAIVRRLAEELSRRTRTELGIIARTRDRLLLAPPERN